MATQVFNAFFLISHRNGSTTLNSFRSGYLSGSGSGANAWWCGHAFFDHAVVASFLVGKVVDGVRIRLTISDYGVSGSISMYLHKAQFKYSDSASRLNPNDYYPGGNYSNPDGTVIGGYIQTPTMARQTVVDVTVPLDFLTHVLGGWGIATYRRNVSTPSGTVYTREATAVDLVIDYHEAGSIKTNVGGTYRNGVPHVNVGGVWRQGIAFMNAGGVWRQGIS